MSNRFAFRILWLSMQREGAFLERSNQMEMEGERVPKTEVQKTDAPNNQILFPMAVGALFIVLLVAGALLG